ncbi:MAG: hypothetical protein ACPGXX_15755, partial [Planctomycetaceae bacterium]
MPSSSVTSTAADSGFSLGSMFHLQAQASEKDNVGGPGWGKAKSIIMIYLQGGPSHLDLWDP